VGPWPGAGDRRRGPKREVSRGTSSARREAPCRLPAPHTDTPQGPTINSGCLLTGEGFTALGFLPHALLIDSTTVGLTFGYPLVHRTDNFRRAARAVDAWSTVPVVAADARPASGTWGCKSDTGHAGIRRYLAKKQAGASFLANLLAQ